MPHNTYDFDWVDAFSDHAFGGNGCAVVHGGAGLKVQTCTNYVQETSLVECTFTGPSDCADIRVRYFLASREIPFAGHPTIATVTAMRQRGLIGDGPLRLETQAGIVEVDVRGADVKMTQIRPEFGPYVPAPLVAAVGRIAPEDILHRPRIVSTGLPFCIAVLKDRKTLESLKFDPHGFTKYCKSLGLETTDVMEPFWVVQEGATQKGDTFSRLLLAPPSPPEDPFTGSATGAMAAYLWSEGLIETPKFIAQQGHNIGRAGEAHVEVLGSRASIDGVVVSGRGYVLMSGQVHFSDE